MSEAGIECLTRRRGRHLYEAIYENRDYWRTVQVNEVCRGNRVNISYVDHRIKQELIDAIIKPVAIAPPYNVLSITFERGEKRLK